MCTSLNPDDKNILQKYFDDDCMLLELSIPIPAEVAGPRRALFYHPQPSSNKLLWITPQQASNKIDIPRSPSFQTPSVLGPLSDVLPYSVRSSVAKNTAFFLMLTQAPPFVAEDNLQHINAPYWRYFATITMMHVGDSWAVAHL